MEKALLAVTAVGASLIFAAVAYFSLTGSGFGGDLISGAAGFALAWCSSPCSCALRGSGRLIAASLFVLLVVGCLVLATPDLLLALVEDHPGRERFLSGFVGATVFATLLRSFGMNPAVHRLCGR